MIFNNILDMIGNTPLYETQNMVPNNNVKLYIKLEGYNPTGSHKDRPAFTMIKTAIEKGILHPGKKLIEVSSGNMATAMAMVAASYGIPVTMVLANTTSEKKSRLTHDGRGAYLGQWKYHKVFGACPQTGGRK